MTYFHFSTDTFLVKATVTLIVQHPVVLMFLEFVAAFTMIPHSRFDTFVHWASRTHPYHSFALGSLFRPLATPSLLPNSEF